MNKIINSKFKKHTRDQIIKKCENGGIAYGRISNIDLSKKIEMSPPPTLRRVRDLEDNGYIDGFRANLDPSKLGYDLVAWIFVSLKNQNEESLGSFEKLVWGWEPIRECFMLNGEIDFILKCVVKNMNEFNNFKLYLSSFSMEYKI